MSDNGHDNKDLNLNRELYSIRIKSTLAAVKEMSFEEFLKKYFELGSDYGISSYEIFRNAIFDPFLAVEYAIKEKDDELLKYVDDLIKKLEDEQKNNEGNIPLGKLFAKLLRKAKSLCEAGMLVSRIMFTFEFMDFSAILKEKIADIENEDLFDDSKNRYSNN